MLKRHLIFALIAAFLAAVSPAHAQRMPPETQEPGVLTVPFDPPIGLAMPYRVLVEKVRPRGKSALEYEQELTFEKLGDGYVVHIAVSAVSIDGNRYDLASPNIRAAIPPAVQPFIMSVKMELDSVGEPVRLQNWDSIRTMLAQLPDSIMEHRDAGDPEVLREAVSQIFAPLIASTAEEAPGFIVKGWPLVLGYGGMELEDGELYEAETDIEGGLLLYPIAADVELTMRTDDNGDFEFRQMATVDPDALSAAASGIVERFRDLSPRRPESGSREDEIDQLAMTDGLEITFARDTGVPRRVRIERVTIVNESFVGTDFVTITERSK